jgi:hypothetical protein
MSWVTLRKSHTWEDVYKSLGIMIKKIIILNESVGKTGLFDKYYCVSKYVEGNVKSGMKRK